MPASFCVPLPESKGSFRIIFEFNNICIRASNTESQTQLPPSVILSGDWSPPYVSPGVVGMLCQTLSGSSLK